MRNSLSVSIIIPTYNQPQYIEQAVKSALAQDYSNVEIIVSDDSPNQTSKKILEQYILDRKITYYHNTPKLGRVENYFYTLRNYATGDWVLNLDGDDFLVNKKFISKSIEILDKDKDISMVCGREMVFNETTNELSSREPSLISSQVMDGNKVFFHKRELGINFYHLSTLYNRKKAINVGFYEVNCLGADTLSLMKLLINTKVAFIDEVGGAWRVHDHNDSFTEDVDILIDNIQSLNTLKKFLMQHQFDINKIDSWVEKAILNRFETYMIFLLKKRKFHLAYKLLIKFKKNDSCLFMKIFTEYRRLFKLIIVTISPKVYDTLSK